MGKLSAAKKKEYREEYKKQKRRINRYIRTKQKQGFTFEEDIRVSGLPQNITKKDIQKLRKITPERILKQATYLTYDRENKEVKYVSGIEGRKIHRKEQREFTISRNKFKKWQREVEDFESEYGSFTWGGYVDDEPDEIEDRDLLASQLINMVLEFDPASFGLKGKTAHIAKLENDRLAMYIQHALATDPDGLVKRIADNYDELRSIVDRVQNYVNVSGDVTRFMELITGGTLDLKENLEATEQYNDSEALSTDEIEDYDEIE